MELKVKPLYCYIDIKPFKYNDIYIINKLLTNNLRISNIYDSLYYGLITFDSNKHDNWNIELSDEYQKNKTNSIVILLKENSKDNPRNYKYLIIFQNITNACNSYGYIWVKDDDIESLTKVSIDYIFDNIIQNLNKDINLWPEFKYHEIVASRYKKYNAVELEEEYKKYIETYRALTYDDWSNSLRLYNDNYKI